MSLKIYTDLLQGSDEWFAARCGMLTASEVKYILTPTLKVADNDKTRAHLWELLAQRITKHVEPHYQSDDMMRGYNDEAMAVYLYSEKIAPVQACGFMVRDDWGFKIGYSPDGLVGADGVIECKSRRQKHQVQTICENLPAGQIAPEYVMQAQTGLLVSGRAWLDHISYSGGLPMSVIRVWPDPVVQEAIIEAATAFEAKIAEKLEVYQHQSRGLLPTERAPEIHDNITA